MHIVVLILKLNIRCPVGNMNAHITRQPHAVASLSLLDQLTCPNGQTVSFVILLCLTLDDFTHQWRASGWEIACLQTLHPKRRRGTQARWERAKTWSKQITRGIEFRTAPVPRHSKPEVNFLKMLHAFFSGKAHPTETKFTYILQQQGYGSWTIVIKNMVWKLS